MRNRYIALIIGFSFLIFFSGCSSRLVDFTIISTKNVDLSDTGYLREKIELREKTRLASLFFSLWELQALRKLLIRPLKVYLVVLP